MFLPSFRNRLKILFDNAFVCLKNGFIDCSCYTGIFSIAGFTGTSFRTTSAGFTFFWNTVSRFSNLVVLAGGRMLHRMFVFNAKCDGFGAGNWSSIICVSLYI